MKTAGFWTKDWFLGLAVAIVLVEQGSPLATIGQLLAEAEGALNTDRKLAASYEKAGTVLLPMLFELGDPRGKPDRPLPDYVTRNALGAIGAAAPELPFPTLQLNPKLAPALVAFLDRAMAKDADARFQTGEEFAQAQRACVGTRKLQVDITI